MPTSTTETDGWVVNFPTLGDLVDRWVAAHCIVPDGFRKGDPFEMYDWQLWCTYNHYRVKRDARPAWLPLDQGGQLGTAFFYRRSQIVAPQKSGKSPWAATIVCNEAVGPALFAGWAEDGDVYRCSENGCGCGWEYPYEAGDAMGMPWPTPLIQLTATSEDQVDNVYRPLQAMARHGALAELMRVGEQFIRLPNDGRIDVVTSSATARLGQPITFPLQDETGLWTKTNKMVNVAETQRRGVAGMGGRSMETTNAWDPSQQSVAQRTASSLQTDIFRFHELAPASLSYKRKDERRRIHRHVYRGAGHVDLDSIEAEAAELLELDPAQAERFFGNRLVAATGAWMPDGLWEESESKTIIVSPHADICLGFDGSESDDWTALRAETIGGHRFTPTYGPDRRPTVWNPAEWGGSIPRGEVHAALDEICSRYRVRLAYCDPFGWNSELVDWQLLYSAEVFKPWATNQTTHMHTALVRTLTDLQTGRSTHDACPITEEHIRNAVKVAATGDRYILGKPMTAGHQKIDMAMADTLAHEAASDARADGWKPYRRSRMVVRS